MYVALNKEEIASRLKEEMMKEEKVMEGTAVGVAVAQEEKDMEGTAVTAVAVAQEEEAMSEAREKATVVEAMDKVSGVVETSSDVKGQELDTESERDFNNVTGALSPITSEDTVVHLCENGGYYVTMQIVVEEETLKVEGCKFYLTNAQTMLPCIGSSSELKLTKQKIMSAVDHSVMNILNQFDVNFSEDNRKLAFERAKEFIEVGEKRTMYNRGQDIMSAYVDLMNYAKKEAKREDKDVTIPEDRKNYKIEVKDGQEIVCILAEHMQQALDDIDVGYTKAIFCKKLQMVSAHYGKTFVIKGRKTGYGCNTTNNIRYYKFNVVDEVIKLYESKDKEEKANV